jgi:hypothetical protein
LRKFAVTIRGVEGWLWRVLKMIAVRFKLACHRVETGLRTKTACGLAVSQLSILLVGNIAEDMEQAGAWLAVRHSQKTICFPLYLQSIV